jgi:8-oxo-dGTP pyrophosphatase MutT (NUDIX family)
MTDSTGDRPPRRRRRRGRRGRGLAPVEAPAGRPGAPTAAPAASAGAASAGAASAGAASAGAEGAADRPSRSRRRRRRGGAGRREVAAPGEGASRHTHAQQDAAPPTADARPPAAPAAAAPPARPAAAALRRDKAERETSAGGIVYRFHDGEPFFLLIRDSYRNWGFPKGHLEAGEAPQQAAVREVQEETGLGELHVDGAIETIDWFFRFRGKLVHKVCHFFLMQTPHARTQPQREEGITACRWARFEEATRLISYANARAVLLRAHAMVQAERERADG